jgi:hypothetical protein
VWIDIVAGVVLLAGIYAFTQLVGWETRTLTRRTRRRAEDMYGQYADSPRQQRRLAHEREGGQSDEPAKNPHTRAERP